MHDANERQVVYKIMTSAEWSAFASSGTFAGSPIDHQDGFIHLSAHHQVIETARKHFAALQELHLVSVATAPVSQQLKWEVSRGEQLFPHLYGPLETCHIQNHWLILKSENGEHRFPDEF